MGISFADLPDIAAGIAGSPRVRKENVMIKVRVFFISSSINEISRNRCRVVDN
jgi:hypothetical protein